MTAVGYLKNTLKIGMPIIGGAFFAADVVNKGSYVCKAAMGAFACAATIFNACGGKALTAAPIASLVGAGAGFTALVLANRLINKTWIFWK